MDLHFLINNFHRFVQIFDHLAAGCQPGSRVVAKFTPEAPKEVEGDSVKLSGHLDLKRCFRLADLKTFVLKIMKECLENILYTNPDKNQSDEKNKPASEDYPPTPPENHENTSPDTTHNTPTNPCHNEENLSSDWTPPEGARNVSNMEELNKQAKVLRYPNTENLSFNISRREGLNKLVKVGVIIEKKYI